LTSIVYQLKDVIELYIMHKTTSLLS